MQLLKDVGKGVEFVLSLILIIVILYPITLIATNVFGLTLWSLEFFGATIGMLFWACAIVMLRY